MHTLRRWNGWGDESIAYPLPTRAAQFLENILGAGVQQQDATIEQILRTVPNSRLSAHSLVSLDPTARIIHSRGQSFPDWVAMRSGRYGAFPDGVAFPLTNSDVSELIHFAKQTGARIIPYGGGTSVVGHINPCVSTFPVLTVDMGRMNRLLRFDEKSSLATFGAGVSGPDLEAQLRARGCTLGHYPQSFEYSTLGGWVITRSSGQQSLGYGRIEKLFAGGRMETPSGVLELPPFPASAAGPDVREMVLGSEGRFGILTEATVRVTPLPEREEFYALFFPNFELGQEAVRTMVCKWLPLSMLRLSTALETDIGLRMAGYERLISALEKVLSLRGLESEKCMLMVGCTGTEALVKKTRKEVLSIAAQYHGVHVGRSFGKQWHKNRFRSPYLRNTLWDMGYGVDTVETATTWSKVSDMVYSLGSSLRDGLSDISEKVHPFTHLSHVYSTGSSIYTTFLFRLASNPNETLARWKKLKAAACNTIIAQGGTISHQHGVGLDHMPYLKKEKGELGISMIQHLCKKLDPDGILNPGKLVDSEK